MQHIRPYQIPVNFDEDGLKIEVTVFDFISQLYSLLIDVNLVGDLTCLDVNQDQPFSKYVPKDGLVGTFNSGTWYNKAWTHCCDPASDDWMCPIIFGIDETLVGSHLNRASSTPVVFTLSIFSEELRNRPIAWRTLGYVYDTKIHGKTLNNESGNFKKLTSTDNASRYHKIMKAVLKSYVDVQKHGGIPDATVTLGSFHMH